MGAGDEPFVEPVLAAGSAVTVTEMSRPAVDGLEQRFAKNPHFRAFYDRDGNLADLAGQEFSLVPHASVLHHIPDYLAAMRAIMNKHLVRGGSLVSFQDSLWYPIGTSSTRLAGTTMYLSWRLAQGDLKRKLKAFIRRRRGELRTDDPNYMVEYHVIRNGVDQRAIYELLAPRFTTVDVVTYWSTQAGVWQGVGERLGLKNTFAVWTSGFTG